MEYVRRLIDDQLDKRAESFGAIHIIGPKGCGKTRTAKERCKTIIEFQDEEKRAGYLAVAQTSPSLFLKNEKPILFDEWQDAVKIWGTVRKACDDAPEETGVYYLTGSTSQKVKTPHTGTGRITELQLYPLTLWEMKESNGSVSLTELFEHPENNSDGHLSTLRLEDLFFSVCRGGWPRCLALKSKEAKLEIAKDYYRQICDKDVQALDDTDRNPQWVRALLWSYARNMATLAKKKSIYADVKANHSVSDVTLASYIEALKKLYVIKDIDAWTPQIRSKTAIRASKKHIFIDPSIGLAALGIGPEYFMNDLDLFGHVFENLVIRDLLAYAEVHDARVMHYSDDTGMEVDAIYQLADGRYALIEIKTGEHAVPAAEKGLLKFKELIQKHNEEVMKNPEHPGVKYREPSLMIVICANATMSYTTENGVKVIPIGCLKD
ncbi:MAG: ATP-binding protein [Erysipelotrichaceae bacterium]|nr:ATP-binding protein [Erysipelotrichaceae bacterium]